MDYPKISILIPTYNQSEYITTTVESALNQEYSNLEVIVVDDCSTDDTIEKIRPFIDRKAITYIRNKENIGRVRNYHKSLYEHAHGEWVLNLDGDDYLTDPKFLRDAMHAVSDCGRSDVVFVQAGHDIESASSGGGQSIRCLPNISKDQLLMSGVDYFLTFDRIGHFSHLSTLYRRVAALPLDFYRRDILSTDVESLLRMALHGDVLLLKRSVGVWRHHETNTFNDLDPRAYINNVEWVRSCYSYALEHRSAKIGTAMLTRWRQKQVAVSLSKYLGIEALLVRKDKKTYIAQFLRYIVDHEPHVLTDPIFLTKLLLAYFGSLRFYKFIASLRRGRIMNGFRSLG